MPTYQKLMFETLQTIIQDTRRRFTMFDVSLTGNANYERAMQPWVEKLKSTIRILRLYDLSFTATKDYFEYPDSIKALAEGKLPAHFIHDGPRYWAASPVTVTVNDIKQYLE